MITTKHDVTVVETNERSLVLLIDGRRVEVSWQDLSVRLSDAPQVARETMEISPSGYGVHWPLVDEDLSIDGILRDFA